ACGPLISPSRLVSSNSKSKTASFGGSARTGADTSSTTVTKATSALMIVIPVSEPRNGKMRGCKLGQFGHVSSQDCLQDRTSLQVDGSIHRRSRRRSIREEP